VVRLTRFALRRPRVTLATWGCLTAVLAVLGLGVENRLSASSIQAPGTQSARAAALDHAAFGTNESVPILLRGPARALDRQGPRLVSALRARWSVLSPWGPSAISRLRPDATAAVVLTDLTYSSGVQLGDRLTPLRRVIAAELRPPVRASLSGTTAIGQALNEQTLGSVASAQMVAIPVLMLVLLLVFRAPIAAAIPATIGLATVASSAGLVSLSAHALSLTALAVSIAAMIGLALGVDYSLLIVSRFREELAGACRDDASAAAEIATRTAGRTVLFAGVALLLAMVVATALAPGDVLVSITAGVVIAVLLSVGSCLAVVPAALALLGDRIDTWRLGAPRTQSRILTGIAAAASRFPRSAVLGVGTALLALAAPALALRTAAINPTELPAGNPARVTFERIGSLLGYGYAAPFEIVLRTNSGTITSPRALAQLSTLQRRLAGDRSVSSALGPGVPASRSQRSSPRTSAAGRSEINYVLEANGARRTARIYVFPKVFTASASGARLHDELSRQAADFARATGMTVAVGGLSSDFIDYQRTVSTFIPLLIAVLSALTYMLLVVILRALILPAVAIAMNLLVVAATFGALALLFQGSSPLLGGPGSIDIVTAVGIFSVLFALSIDYQVFLMARMHEGYDMTGDPQGAIVHGIGRTARVVTGAALIMTAVFFAFGSSSFIIPRQFGVGLAIAVLLDAFVLRMFMLPAAMTLLGRWSWWAPRWLQRILPRIDVEGAGVGKAGQPSALVVSADGHDAEREPVNIGARG
jgi:RND superfamily putative drug exporter